MFAEFACFQPRLCAPLTAVRPSLLHAQVCLKVGASKPHNRNSFSIKPVLVCTSKGSSHLVWLQEPKQVTKEVKRLLAQWQAELFPKPYLVSFDAVVEYFLSEYKAGRVGAEFVGHNRIYGMAWPPLDEYDENHAAIFSVHGLAGIIERYWGSAEMLEFEDEDEDEVLSEGRSSECDDDNAMEVEEGESADDDRKNAVRAARAVPTPSRAVPAPFPRRSLVPPAPVRCACAAPCAKPTLVCAIRVCCSSCSRTRSSRATPPGLRPRWRRSRRRSRRRRQTSAWLRCSRGAPSRARAHSTYPAHVATYPADLGPSRFR